MPRERIWLTSASTYSSINEPLTHHCAPCTFGRHSFALWSGPVLQQSPIGSRAVCFGETEAELSLSFFRTKPA